MTRQKNIASALKSLSPSEKQSIESTLGISVQELASKVATADDLTNRIEEVREDIESSGFSGGTLYTSMVLAQGICLLCVGSSAAPIFLVGGLGAGIATLLTGNKAKSIMEKLGGK